MIDKILKDIKGLFKVQDKAKFLKQNIPYLAFFYLGNIFSNHLRSYVGGDVIDKIFQGILELNTISFFPSVHPMDILTGIAIAALIKFIVYTKGKNAKKFRQGKEYGSARWGTKKDIEPYMDEKFQNNILLTQTERLTMNGRPYNPKYARNKNVLVIGGSGSGKTRFYVKPNLMQMHSSYCVTDPKGQLKYARALNLPLKFTYFRERRWQKWLNLRLYGILPSTSDSLKMMNLRVNLTVFPIRKST